MRSRHPLRRDATQAGVKMAICNFRVDTLGFDAHDGVDARRILELLERIEHTALLEKDLDEGSLALLRYATQKGMVVEHQGAYTLSGEGRRLLRAGKDLLGLNPDVPGASHTGPSPRKP